MKSETLRSCIALGKKLEKSDSARLLSTIQVCRGLSGICGYAEAARISALIDDIAEDCPDCPNMTRDELYRQIAIFHLTTSIVDRARLLGAPLCSVEREWMESLAAGKLGYWAPSEIRKRSAKLTELITGEEIIAETPLIRRKGAGTAVLSIVVSFRGKHYLTGASCFALERDLAEFAAARVRIEMKNAGTSRPGARGLINAWKDVSDSLRRPAAAAAAIAN